MLTIFTVLINYLSPLLHSYIYSPSSTSLGFDMVCFEIPEFGLIIPDGSFPMKGERNKIY